MIEPEFRNVGIRGRVMATRDVQNEQIADAGLAATEASAGHKDAGQFVEFSRMLFDLTLTLNRTVIFIGVIGLVAIGVAYLAASAQQPNVAAAALSVFALAFLGWLAITGYRIWLVVTGSRKWWKARRDSSGQKAPSK